ncbi:MAG: ABC-2 transporter permease [Bacillus sp. (in: Bacteria)]|nr:ABC-2 transporter permease [Bacillus sp. (in: firmicutes)]
MKQLIIKDILSIRKTIKIIFFSMTSIWILLFLLSLNPYIGIWEFVSIPLVMVAFVSYVVISTLCDKEFISGIENRILQLPVSINELVVSRFMASFLILITILIFNSLVLLIGVLVSGSPLSELSSLLGFFLFLFHFVFYTASVYLIFHFSFSYGTSVWLGRLFVVFWFFFIYALSVLLILNKYDIASIPAVYFENLVIAISGLGLLLVVLSIGIAAWGYRLKRQGRSVFQPIMVTVLYVVVMFVGSGLLAENQLTDSIREILDETKLEQIEVNVLDFSNELGQVHYQVIFQIELSQLTADWAILDETILTYSTSGATREYTKLVGGGIPLSSAYGGFSESDTDKILVGFQETGPELLTEEDKEAFLMEFTEEDFHFTLQSAWISEEISLGWNK